MCKQRFGEQLLQNPLLCSSTLIVMTSNYSWTIIGLARVFGIGSLFNLFSFLVKSLSKSDIELMKLVHRSCMKMFMTACVQYQGTVYKHILLQHCIFFFTEASNSVQYQGIVYKHILLQKKVKKIAPRRCNCRHRKRGLKTGYFLKIDIFHI